MHDQNRFRKILKKLNPFVEVWIPFFLVAVIFVLGLLDMVALPVAEASFRVILGSYLIWVIVYLVRNRSKWREPIAIVASGLFLFFFLKGAYLEYPSDAWEYFRLITEWQSRTSFSDMHVTLFYGAHLINPPRFSYLFFWSQLQMFPRESWRTVLDLISAGTLVLVFVQIYELAKVFQSSVRKAVWMAIFGFIFTGVFNLNYFYSLALSTNILSFIFFYRILTTMTRFIKDRNSSELWILIPILPLMFFTHLQGLLWVLVALISFVFYLQEVDQDQRRRRHYVWTIWGILLLSSLPIIYLHGEDFLKHYYSETEVFFDTLGRPGVIFLILGFFFRKRIRLMWALSFVPVLFLTLPVLVYPLFRYILTDQSNGHRLLYLLPTGFLIYQIIDLSLAGRFKYLKENIVILLVLVSLSIDARRPWFGRLPHLIMPIPNELSLKSYDPVVFWLEKNRPDVKFHCRYATDQVTDFLLTTYFGWHPINARISRWDLWLEDQFKMAPFSHQICGLILRDASKSHLVPESQVNQELHHWIPEVVSPDLMLTDQMKSIASELTSEGWQKTLLPADYVLIERP